MPTYLNLRRGGWETAHHLEDTAGPSSSEHAGRADMPADEILAVANTVVVRPDPEPACT